MALLFTGINWDSPQKAWDSLFFDHCGVEFILGNMKIFLYFLSFLNSERVYLLLQHVAPFQSGN